jgi:beta-barrel assembly-enhancing protease
MVMTANRARTACVSSPWRGTLSWRGLLLGAALGLGAPLASLAQEPTLPQRQNLPALGHSEGISLGAERELGDRIARELYRDPDYLEDPVLDEYLQRLWAPLVQAAVRRGELGAELRERFAWRILIGRDRSINAFALPGGYLGVHLGLIAAVGSDDELASVLAHELSHVTQRHIARSIDDQARMAPWVIGSMILGALAAGKSAQGAQALIVGGQAAALQQQLRYSRDMEREADRIGFAVHSEAGYDPQGFVGMFGRLQQASALNDSGAFPYLRSHPLTTERIADMQARQSLQPPRPVAAPGTVQALMAARARVLAMQGADTLRAWAAEPQPEPGQALAEQAGRRYAAVMAQIKLGEGASALRQVQALQALVASEPAAARQVRLLHAEVLARQGQWAQALQILQSPSLPPVWPRPELMAIGQALAQLPAPALQAPPMAALQAQALSRLREQVLSAPAASRWRPCAPKAKPKRPVSTMPAHWTAFALRRTMPGAGPCSRASTSRPRSSTVACARCKPVCGPRPRLHGVSAPLQKPRQGF